MIDPSHLSSIVEAGVRAPSADNKHAFTVEATPQGLRLLADEAFVVAPTHKRVLALITFGAVVENMCVRAARLGYDVAVREQVDAAPSRLVAELTLAPGTPLDDGLDAAIATRHTNRRLVFAGPALDDAELAAMCRSAEAIPGITATFVRGRERAAVLRLMTIAEAERFNAKPLHHDLFAAMRFDVGWRASAETGLPPAALSIEPGLRWAFTQLRHWSLMNALRKVGAHRVLGIRAASLPARFAPHLGILYTRSPLDRGGFSAGRALERIWLRAEKRGLALQPFAAAPLLALPDYQEVPSETRRRLQLGWRALSPDTPAMVFRMGRAGPPANRTSRPSATGFLR